MVPHNLKSIVSWFHFKNNFLLQCLPTDNRREFSIRDVDKCELLSVWPEADHIPFIKIVEGTDKSLLEGLYQFAHLSFQGIMDNKLTFV